MARRHITDEEKNQIYEAVKLSPLSMQHAAKIANIPYRTFIYRAQKLGIYTPNPAGIGVSSKRVYDTTPLDEILLGLHPNYDTASLKKRLVESNILEYCCAKCENDGMWQGNELTLQLNHIDGNSYNHRLENLEFLCPNCHTQTDTWGGRNKNKKRVSDEELVDALRNTKSIPEALRMLGISKSTTNYNRAKKLKMKIKGLVL